MLIGISGKIGSGKDYLARAIQNLDHSFTIAKFADNLKRCCAIMTGEEDQWSSVGKETVVPDLGMSVGQIQQLLGTEVGRAIHPDLWIVSLFRQYHGQNWIITDMRFKNEARAIHDRGGMLIRLDGSFTGPGNRDPSHRSEADLDDWEVWDLRYNPEEMHNRRGELGLQFLEFVPHYIISVARSC